MRAGLTGVPGARRWGLGDALSLTSLRLFHWFRGSGSNQLSVPVFLFEDDYFELYLDRALCSHFLPWSSDTHLTPSHPPLTCWGMGLSKEGIQGSGTRAVKYEGGGEGTGHTRRPFGTDGCTRLGREVARGRVGRRFKSRPARKAAGHGECSHLPGEKKAEGLARLCLPACLLAEHPPPL